MICINAEAPAAGTLIARANLGFAQLLAEKAARHEEASSSRAGYGKGQLTDIARKCFTLAESSTDRDIAAMLAEMGRDCLEKARADAHRQASPRPNSV